MSYELFRTDVLYNMTNRLPDEMIGNAIEAVDQAATRYDFNRKEVALSVVGELPQALKDYMVAKATRGLSKGTLDNYLRTLKCFFYATRKPVDQIETNDIRQFLNNYQRIRNVTDRYMESIRIQIHSFFGWCMNEGIITRNPTVNVDAYKYYEKQREPMEQIELEQMRMCCKTLREKAIVDFLYSTGCRVSELCNLKKTDVNLETRDVRIRCGKGRKDRITYMNAESVMSLKAYLASRTDDCDALFVPSHRPFHHMQKKSIEYIISKIYKRTNIITKVTPHILRHTFATTAIHNGCPVPHVQQMLGHAKLQTTMIYAKIVDDDVKLSHERCVI